jgi:phthalate 4,5-dioxygenase
MGKLMRQHWMPTCMREEGAERDGAPLKVRLLGEDMVVFRDTEGHLGALDEQCPHRRASLAFGRNEECGLRCLYHGWKFDVNGNAVDLSSEPVDTRLRQTMKTKAYPVREAGGFVWVWMGDPKKVTPFDMPAWAPTDATNIAIVKMHAKCNWAQVLEGSIDSAHSSSLHSSNMPTATDSAWLRPSADKSPRFEVQKTSFGFRYAAIRKPKPCWVPDASAAVAGSAVPAASVACAVPASKAAAAVVCKKRHVNIVVSSPSLRPPMRLSHCFDIVLSQKAACN